jgi:hypothetical protein
MSEVVPGDDDRGGEGALEPDDGDEEDEEE